MKGACRCENKTRFCIGLEKRLTDSRSGFDEEHDLALGK